MIKYPDPLTTDDLEVNDVSTAMYTLKITNDLSFAIHWQGVTMEKEYARNAQETFELQRDLVAPYLETDTSITSEGFEVQVHLTSIPNPLPAVVPDNIKAAVKYLDEQSARNRERLLADLAEETAPLKESKTRLEGKVKAWFKSAVEHNADWLKGNKAVLSGCTLRYSAGNVTFDYHELNYD